MNVNFFKKHTVWSGRREADKVNSQIQNEICVSIFLVNNSHLVRFHYCVKCISFIFKRYWFPDFLKNDIVQNSFETPVCIKNGFWSLVFITEFFNTIVVISMGCRVKQSCILGNLEKNGLTC